MGAAMTVDMFLNIEDKKVKGESRDKVHKDTIEILKWSWGVTQSGCMHNGGSPCGKADLKDLSLTKYVDKSSPDLIKACITGNVFESVKLIVRKAGGTPLEYVVIDLKWVLVTSVSTGCSGEDRMTENLTMNFGKVKFQYQPQKADGGKDGGVLEVGWDQQTLTTF
jgi:type VI secretion system secreted protein Hcp